MKRKKSLCSLVVWASAHQSSSSRLISIMNEGKVFHAFQTKPTCAVRCSTQPKIDDRREKMTFSVDMSKKEGVEFIQLSLTDRQTDREDDHRIEFQSVFFLTRRTRHIVINQSICQRNFIGCDTPFSCQRQRHASSHQNVHCPAMILSLEKRRKNVSPPIESRRTTNRRSLLSFLFFFSH